MYLAVGIQHAVHPEGTFIVGCDDGLEPTLYVVLEFGGEAHSLRYLSVGQQQVGTVDAVLGAEKGIAYEEQTALGDAVFEGEIGHHLTPGFGQEDMLLRQHSVYPIPVQRGEAAADPSQSPARPRPGGFEHPMGLKGEKSVDLLGGVDKAGVRLQGEEGLAVLQRAP
jgi:hypothetical protein